MQRLIVVLIFSIEILTLCQSSYVPLSEEIIDEIYFQNEHYLIYSYEQPMFTAWSVFMEFCLASKKCAFIDESVNKYTTLRQFIGSDLKQYFLLIDGKNSRKYFLDASEVYSIDDIYRFQKKFNKSQLTPFYVSEKKHYDNYLPCRNLTSLQMKDYLEQPGIKVIFLYSIEKKCRVCGEMLRYFADTAENYYKKDIISFAYLNVYYNDHSLIKTKKTPSFLLFETASKSPQIYSAETYRQMQKRISNLLFRRTGEKKSLTKHDYDIFQNLEDF